MWQLILFLGVCSSHWTAARQIMMRDQQIIEIDDTNSSETILVKAGSLFGMEDLTYFSITGHQITKIAKDALIDLPYLIKLDLSRNRLEEFDQSVISGIKKLEHLSLNLNRLKDLGENPLKFDHLKVLDVRNNDLKSIKEINLRDLPKSAVVLLKGNENLLGFKDNTIKSSCDGSHMRWEVLHPYESQRNAHLSAPFDGDNWLFGEREICRFGGKVVHLRITMEYHSIYYCSYLPRKYEWTIDLAGLGIAEFDDEWYDSSMTFKKINLSNNNISKITPELLNDLPSSVIMVDLTNNPISILKKNVIENRSLKMLKLTVEGGSGIENGAFEKTNLELLGIESKNDLDVNFIKTLSTSLKKLFLDSCNFVPFDENILSTLTSLEVVSLSGCKFTNLPVALFRGLTKLKSIYLTHNSFENIEIGTFDDNVDLQEINLSDNLIKVLSPGLFRSNRNLKKLYVDHNQLTKISRGTFSGLERSQITYISLRENLISEIEEGIFSDINSTESDASSGGTIGAINLDNNSLTKLNGGVFSGVDVEYLRIHGNPLNTLGKNALRNVCQFEADSINTIESGGLHGIHEASFYNLRNLISIPADVFKL